MAPDLLNPISRWRHRRFEFLVKPGFRAIRHSRQTVCSGILNTSAISLPFNPPNTIMSIISALRGSKAASRSRASWMFKISACSPSAVSSASVSVTRCHSLPPRLWRARSERSRRAPDAFVWKQSRGNVLYPCHGMSAPASLWYASCTTSVAHRVKPERSRAR